MLQNNFKCNETLLMCLITAWNAVFVILESLCVTVSGILQLEKTQVSTLYKKFLLILLIRIDGLDKKRSDT